MKKSETYGMNIIEGTDRIDYTVINENTEFTEALLKENADGIEALSDDVEAIEEAMADDVAEINKRLKKVEIKATETVTAFSGDITGDNFSIKNPNTEAVTVEYNGLSEDIPAGEIIEVRIFIDENDYHLELTASADIELTYCMRNQKYIQKIASEGITVDEELSATSTNPAQNRAISAEFTKFDGKKIDKIEGKDLSTNDFTNEEKEKLADLENYDDTEIRAEIENCVQVPQVAEVGQVLAVKAVDESGKPAEWECVEKGGGGTGNDLISWFLIDSTHAITFDMPGVSKNVLALGSARLSGNTPRNAIINRIYFDTSGNYASISYFYSSSSSVVSSSTSVRSGQFRDDATILGILKSDVETYNIQQVTL